MSNIFAKIPRIYPTRRLAGAFAAGALWFFAVPWGGAPLFWLGIAHNLTLLALVAFDVWWLADSRECSVSRARETVLSINEQNPVRIEALHRGVRRLNAQVMDEPPIEFEAPERCVGFDLEPGEIARKSYRVKPGERGDYAFGDLNVRYTTKLGLLTRQERVPSEMLVKVYPDIAVTKKHLLLAKENRAIQMGLRRSRIAGQGQEFERLRDYVPDDSIRHIDWMATARRNVLTTREYDVEHSQTIMILIDVGRTMASRTIEPDGKLGITKADCAINAAVLLAHVSAQSDDRVGLFCFASRPVSYLAPGKGAPQATKLLEALYPLKPRLEESNYYESFILMGEKQRKRSLVFLFTDLIDSEASNRLISSVGLLARKHLVVCVALADYELPTIIESKPGSPSEVYTQAVALNMTRERKRALARMASQGILTIDATPSDLSIATVNQYLKLKREGRL